MGGGGAVGVETPLEVETQKEMDGESGRESGGGEVAAGEVCAEMQFRSTFPLLCAAASGGRCVLGGGGGASKTGVPNGMRLLRHKSPHPRFVLLVHFILSWYT